MICDEDYGTIEFPRSVRRELIDDHIERHGRYCTKCSTRVRRCDLQVDHIVALINNGRTSRANARVICRWCNASKGGRNDVLDYFLGRCA
jgi:5-methylcytosine-specific restriction endonuclease McrA